jgi:hypothetical protein
MIKFCHFDLRECPREEEFSPLKNAEGASQVPSVNLILRLSWGARKLTGDNLKHVWVEFST